MKYIIVKYTNPLTVWIQISNITTDKEFNVLLVKANI